MSADNGIYVASFPNKDGGKEFRVAHAQAIENTTLNFMPNGENKTKLQDAYRVLIFGQSAVFANRDQALQKAAEVEDEIMNSNYAVLEYGICFLDFDRPLVDLTYEEAEEAVRSF